jgi:hypothetical protein
MNTQRYVVQVWKTENRITTKGADYDEVTDAYIPVEAAKKILEAKHILGKFYVEVRLKGNNVDCWRFTDISPKLNS